MRACVARSVLAASELCSRITVPDDEATATATSAAVSSPSSPRRTVSRSTRIGGTVPAVGRGGAPDTGAAVLGEAEQVEPDVAQPVEAVHRLGVVRLEEPDRVRHLVVEVAHRA